MHNIILKKLIIWLRRKSPGTIVKLRDFWIYYMQDVLGIVPLSATLRARHLKADGSIVDLGIVCTHKVTDTFVAQLIDTLQSAEATFSDYKYHDSGTGTTAESETDTALETPTGEARAVGTQIEGATANIYKSVATFTYEGDYAITEHGLLNAAAVGDLADRSVFTAIIVVANDRIEFTYTLVCSSGG